MNAQISKHEIGRVKDSVQLSEVVGRYVDFDRKKSQPRSGVFWACCPFHGEKSPSFKVDDRKGFYHCFAGETRVITWAGVKPIAELAGETHKVLTRGSVWVDAEFKCYGEQQIWEMHLQRNQCRKVIRTTEGHRWFVRTKADKHAEKITSDLRPGHRLESISPPTDSDTSLDLDGIRHGFVFGDGTKHRAVGRVALYADKRAYMAPFFPKNGNYHYGEVTVVPNLPGHFKRLPHISLREDYLRGFIAGLLAADGCVAADGTVILNNKDTEVLSAVRDIATRLGYVTSPITTQSRVGINQTEASTISRIHFMNANLPSEIFLNPTHKKRFLKRKKKFSRLRWVVNRVVKTEDKERVYCAEVPGQNAFALEDNLLTGNCFGCGAKGDAITFLREMQGYGFGEAIQALGGRLEDVIPQERKEALERERQARIAEREREQEESDEQRSRVARATFKVCKPIAGTLAERYLIGRGIPEQEWERDRIRFSAMMKYDLYPSRSFPAMVAAVTNAADEIIGIHRTYLDQETAGKARVPEGMDPKLAKGPTAGGAVRIGGIADRISVCEGIETAFGVRAIQQGKHPVWACLGTSGLRGVVLPVMVRHVDIWCDGDLHRFDQKTGKLLPPPGQDAASDLARRLKAEGRTFAINEPDYGDDWLDVWLSIREFT